MTDQTTAVLALVTLAAILLGMRAVLNRHSRPAPHWARQPGAWLASFAGAGLFAILLGGITLSLTLFLTGWRTKPQTLQTLAYQAEGLSFALGMVIVAYPVVWLVGKSEREEAARQTG